MVQKLTSSDVKGLFEKVSNWGRWGKDDQRGALNFITNKKRAAAARLVRTGEVVSMALALDTVAAVDNLAPTIHLMTQVGHDSHDLFLPHSADYFAVAPHSAATTHLDALCHVFFERKMYNGFSAAEVGSRGAMKCAIDVSRDGIVSRGVLLDIARLKKVKWIELGEKIFPDDLDAAEKAQGVHVGEGDVLLVRTGRSARRKEKGGWDALKMGMAGLDASCLGWLHDHRIAILGGDGGNDALPSGYDELTFPIHTGTLVFMGVHLIDNVDLDAVSAKCASLGRSEFLCSIAPLILERGTASPVNPLAMF
jgi:kynurenine formamidase